MWGRVHALVLIRKLILSMRITVWPRELSLSEIGKTSCPACLIVPETSSITVEEAVRAVIRIVLQNQGQVCAMIHMLGFPVLTIGLVV